jgi:predicted acetyltransferase
MDKILSITDIKKCDFEDIKTLVAEYYINNKIIVDAFWESHVRESNYYKILCNSEIIGFFSINNGTVLILFNIFEKYRNISQELFAVIKRFESIKEALIPTGDEFLISHAIDNYVKLEKQAYFSIYTDKNPNKIIPIELKLANIEKDMETLNLCHDFLKGEIENIKNLIDEEIYIVKHENNVIGFGVIEYQKIVDIYASIGMIVREEYRQKGYGANILNGLKNIVKSKEKTPISGCWYYNHNSKKTMESAGAYSKTRLLRFYF